VRFNNRKIREKGGRSALSKPPFAATDELTPVEHEEEIKVSGGLFAALQPGSSNEPVRHFTWDG